MHGLLSVAVVGGVCLAIWRWCPPSWRTRLVDRLTYADEVEQSGEGETGAADQATVDWTIVSGPYIRGRLDALAEELERLDREPDMFAKAFHTMVARSAYEALLADASRLAARPPSYDGQVIAVEAAGTSMVPGEVLDL